mgnify:CR=1 FL=1
MPTLYVARSRTVQEWGADVGLTEHVYKIGVTLGSSVMVTEQDMIEDKSGTALTQAITRTKRQIIEAVFGEFRTDIMMIERALYDHDFQKARSLLVQLEDKMFSTEV